MMSTVALLEVFGKQTIQTITETYLQRGGVGRGGVGMDDLKIFQFSLLWIVDTNPSPGISLSLLTQIMR